MSFDAGAFELGEAFAGPPPTYHLELPTGWRLWRLVRQADQAVRKGLTSSFTWELVRPLSDETGHASVTTMDEQDYTHVQRSLSALFGPKGLVIQDLELRYDRKVSPGRDLDPHDVVKATFTATS